MAKARECLVYVKPRWGVEEPPRYCASIAEAKAYAKARGMTYRITDLYGHQITRGF